MFNMKMALQSFNWRDLCIFGRLNVVSSSAIPCNMGGVWLGCNKASSYWCASSEVPEVWQVWMGYYGRKTLQWQERQTARGHLDLGDISEMSLSSFCLNSFCFADTNGILNGIFFPFQNSGEKHYSPRI